MAKVIVLGSASSIPDVHHGNTHLAISNQNRFIMIDCVNNPIVRLLKAGLDFHQLTDLFLTHFHPDHVSGVPLLLMDMWLLERKTPLRIYGLQHTIERIEKVMDLFGWKDWPNFFPLTFHVLPESNMVLAMDDDFRIYTSPVNHLIPTIGMRIEVIENGKILAYSCDTSPCSSVDELASGADVLIHEATGESLGHSSAFQAGEAAEKAQAKSLYLIHYNVDPNIYSHLTAEAKQAFDGPVFLAEDFLEIDL
ncbi:MAG: MBL fold metallo-hydrolase [Chloroflexi bacterium]|nr:MBL fold metallo-hydrolase [Chloroflexota bacterium]